VVLLIFSDCWELGTNCSSSPKREEAIFLLAGLAFAILDHALAKLVLVVLLAVGVGFSLFLFGFVATCALETPSPVEAIRNLFSTVPLYCGGGFT
jgi:hypothetical protein